MSEEREVEVMGWEKQLKRRDMFFSCLEIGSGFDSEGR